MSSTRQHPSQSRPSTWITPTSQTHPVNEQPRIVLTRTLWERSDRTMTDGNQTDTVLNKSQAQDTPAGHNIASGSSRRTSSSVSSRSQRRSPSPSVGSETPLTPEESPPFSRSTRKRTAGTLEEEDKDLEATEVTPVHNHTRQSSGESGIHVCICQPDPKIPRPRNAFILYRQHHQSSVVAQNPGLANPEISKIIGEQWQNQPPEVKNKWKALAEEEKIRHQQQYPTYRYQPKRSGRRNSLNSEGLPAEKPRCTKCGGRSILAPSTPYTSVHPNNLSPAGPQTPSSAITPVTRTLPVLRDLSLQSPAGRRMGKQFPGSNMSPNHHLDDRDDLGPLSPDLKRRRFNGDQPQGMSRAMPPRYVTAPPPGAVIGPGPGTPFSFGQPQPHPYPPGAAHIRRESLPGLRGMASPAGPPPGPMAPPPRPGPGYQQHRLSQGHIPHDRSLTLPPLQTSSTGVSTPLATAGAGKTAKEQIMGMSFRHKVRVLRQVAPPAPVKKAALRGPLVAIEGDCAEAVKALGSWLNETLAKGDDLAVSFLEGPLLSSEGGKEELMAQYHRLAAEWLGKSGDIRESLAIKAVSPTDSVMVDVAPTPSSKPKTRVIDENYDESENSSVVVAKEDPPIGAEKESSKRSRNNSDREKMEVDEASKVGRGSKNASAKPVSIVANYSLYASNFFACNIPIDAHDPYAPNDHWQWTATQWRGIISPDLTIYVCDAAGGDTGKQTVDILDDSKLFVVQRAQNDSDSQDKDHESLLDVEPSTLRRLGFEVSEWVRAFASKAA